MGMTVIDEHKDEAVSKRKNSRSHQLRLASLYRAFRSGRAVEGSVEGVIKGGFEVRIGKIRGFCPHSQIDLQRAEAPDDHVGKRYLFRISQLRRGGEDVVVSRRAILEDEKIEEAKAVRATLLEGSIMQGRVAGLADFGAFVDLGAGVMGLVHLSELSHTHVARPGDAVKVGDIVNVKILKLDEAADRISLSIRQAQKDPWSEVEDQFSIGKIHSGTVQRVTDFGAFVELAPGIEALAPASEFPPSRLGWRDGLEPGQARDWLVLSVDPGQHRISVTPPVEGMAIEDLPPMEVGASFKGKVQRVEKFGVFVWLGPGRVGLMPNAWSGIPRGEDLSRRFPVGDEIEVDVVELSSNGRRIRLAKKGVEATPAPVPNGSKRRPRQTQDRAKRPAPAAETRNGMQNGQEGFGSILADKLRAALDQPTEES
jgi:small subunit ribosomal protein S1